MGNARDLLMKIGDTKGTFHVKMGTIKNKNGKDILSASANRRRD